MEAWVGCRRNTLRGYGRLCHSVLEVALRGWEGCHAPAMSAHYVLGLFQALETVLALVELTLKSRDR